MQVKLSQRVVFHKYVEVYVDVPNELTEDEIVDFLWQEVDTDELLEAELSKVEPEYGLGIDEYEGMNEPDSNVETRFDCEQLNTGGHL